MDSPDPVGGATAVSLARPWWPATAARWRERRAERLQRPFPSPGRRIRSAVGLVALVIFLGGLVAALIGAAMVTLLIVANHLVG
ncbi:MAG: hypothetical protein AB7W59_00595 [Acidimicrobiia bacterium]